MSLNLFVAFSLNDFISSFKHNIWNSADPEFSLIEDRGGRINIIEISPDEDFEFETRFTIKEVKSSETCS